MAEVPTYVCVSAKVKTILMSDNLPLCRQGVYCHYDRGSQALSSSAFNRYNTWEVNVINSLTSGESARCWGPSMHVHIMFTYKYVKSEDPMSTKVPQ